MPKWRIHAVERLAESLDALELEQVRRAKDAADIGSGAGFPGLALAASSTRCTLHADRAGRETMRVPQAVRRGDGARERRGRTGSGSTVDRRGVAVRSRNGSRAVAGACHVWPCSPAPQRRRCARAVGARPREGSRRGRGASGGASAQLVTGRDPRRGWPVSECVHKDGESLGCGLRERAAPEKGESLAARETVESLAAGKPREISVAGQGSSKARAQGVRVRGADCEGLGADGRAQTDAGVRIETKSVHR